MLTEELNLFTAFLVLKKDDGSSRAGIILLPILKADTLEKSS